MSSVRKASKNDWLQIKGLLCDLDLDHPSLSTENFWVLEDDEAIVGVAHMEDFGKNLYLSAVGVARERQGEGIGREMVSDIISRVDKPVYVYTVVPGFFEKLGFVKSCPSADIPSREIYDCCEACDLNRCQCMVRVNES